MTAQSCILVDQELMAMFVPDWHLVDVGSELDLETPSSDLPVASASQKGLHSLVTLIFTSPHPKRASVHIE